VIETVARAQLTPFAAGTMRYAELKPCLPPSSFPPITRATPHADPGSAKPSMNISRRRSRNGTARDSQYDQSGEDEGYFDDDIDDDDMLAAGTTNSTILQPFQTY